MDVRLFAQAVGRHRFLAAFGVLLTVVLALLSYVSVNPFGDPIFSYRAEQTWVSRVTLQIDEPGFTEGKADNPGRQAELAQLAPLYATLAESDAVKGIVKAQGFEAPDDAVVTEAVVDNGRASLPLVKIAVLSPSAELAVRHVRLQTQAFIRYMGDRQRANKIPEQSRIGLSVVKGASEPTVSEPRKKTLPIVVALAMLILTAALVLVVDNAQRRRAEERDATGDEAGALGAAVAAKQLDSVVASAASRAAAGVAPAGSGVVQRARKARSKDGGQPAAPAPAPSPAPEPVRSARPPVAETIDRGQPTSIAPWRKAAEEDGAPPRLRRANED